MTPGIRELKYLSATVLISSALQSTTATENPFLLLILHFNQFIFRSATTTMPSAYAICCDKLIGELTTGEGIISELRREENDPRPGNPSPVVLLNDLRDIYKVGSEDLQRLRELSRESGGDLAVIQRAAAILQGINTIIPHFATKFEGSG